MVNSYNQFRAKSFKSSALPGLLTDLPTSESDPPLRSWAQLGSVGLAASLHFLVWPYLLIRRVKCLPGSSHFLMLVSVYDLYWRWLYPVSSCVLILSSLIMFFLVLLFYLFYLFFAREDHNSGRGLTSPHTLPMLCQVAIACRVCMQSVLAA